MSARGEQDLQDLFRASATEITCAERPWPVLDFKRTEQTDHRTGVGTIEVIRAHEWLDEASLSRIPVSVLNVLLQLLIDASDRAYRCGRKSPHPYSWSRQIGS
jgi:hypothetical protein